MTREPNDPKDKEILDFIKQFKKENMYSPSVREIGSAVNLKSSSSVNGRLKRLEEQGFIIRDPKKPRTIDFMMGIICILLTITVIGMVALPDVLSAWSAMRMNEIWKEKEENENDF